MLTDERVFNAIVYLAREDTREFFDFNFDISDYDFLLLDLRNIDPTHFTHRYNRMRPLEFSENLLKWLERTRQRPTLTRPWVRKRNGTVSILAREKRLLSFLKHLEGWLNRLISPGSLLSKHEFTPLLLGMKWWEFKDFIRQNTLSDEEWRITFTPADEEEIDFLGEFISWLVLIKDLRTIHIIYNQEKIKESASDLDLLRVRLRKVFLHELGHARTRLTWYRSQLELAIGTTWVCSLPLHEYEAWVYALTIRTLLICARSRLTRIIRDGDIEWRSLV